MTFLEWRFLHPWFLVLLPLPLLWLGWTLWRGRASRPAVVYSSLEPLRAAARRTWRTRALVLVPFLRTMALLLGILALARPQFGTVERVRAAEGIDIAMVLDVSLSMQERDFPPNRLEASKRIMRNFIRQRDTDRISIVLFATNAAILTPPTFDRSALEGFIDIIHRGIIADRSTSIGVALAAAVNSLLESEAASRIVILLTDGENNDGNITPLQAADIAAALGIRVYTIAVTGPYEQFDEFEVREIARRTGGGYFRATSVEALQEVYNEIDRLERTEIEVTEFTDYEERFLFLWAPALALLALELLLRGVVLGRLP